MAKRHCLDPTAGASADSSSDSAGASSSFDSASASSASSSGDYTLVRQCGYVTSVQHPLMRYFNFLGKTLYIHTYTHIYIYTYIHTYIHTYMLVGIEGTTVWMN